MGWRYVYFTCGAIVFAMSMARVLVIRFHETPKYTLCQNKDEEVVKTLKTIAEKYHRPCSLTVEQLQSCGNVNSAHASKHMSLKELKMHLSGLFMTKKMIVSTVLVWLSWIVIGLAYPLFFIFLPDYIASRGADFGEDSAYVTWRDYAITNALAIPGPLIAGCLCRTRLLGRKYTMVIGALLASKCSRAYGGFFNFLLTRNSGFLLCIHGSAKPSPESWLQFRYLCLHQYLLRHFVRLHA
jgi:hypothetical protein